MMGKAWYLGTLVPEYFSTDGCLCIKNIVIGLMWCASKPGDEMYFVGSRALLHGGGSL